MRYRPAVAADAGSIAALHADSWRRHYRGAYADSFLDGDVLAERRARWAAIFAAPGESATLLAECDGTLLGFVHVLFDADPRWGSLVDNLHVVHDRRRSGIGRTLLRHAARAVLGRNSTAMYLWVLERNFAAQRFYHACGATRVERAPVPAPGGVAHRLAGTPHGLRMAWLDVTELAGSGAAGRHALDALDT